MDAGIQQDSQALIGFSGPTLLAEMFILVSTQGALSKLRNFPPCLCCDIVLIGITI